VEQSAKRMSLMIVQMEEIIVLSIYLRVLPLVIYLLILINIQIIKE